ncbi:ferrochelatase [Sporolactobacillus putidus]|uniref:Coproporphyrin III ferrochelatase n=1 Tax=Sporolactobacillus putidus TaxID=492735 RepID=A0A917VYT4_9BACL|nr:ferrochelatase [Sporolactobacillus putidus]GGL46258.1 ferrochelatase [Sporolactobacillus putidus]
MENETVGLLVMAYGTPYQKEDIVPYYTAIRHGRRPSDEQIADLTRRYERIGGSSPLAELTRQQALALESRLNVRRKGLTFKTYLGLKYIHPFIEDTVKRIHNDGIDRAVALVLAPHYSRFSVQSYADRARAAAEKSGGPKILPIESWYREADFIRFWTKQIQQTLALIPKPEQDQSIVIFSAHSLPEKILKNGDPYPDQVAETAESVAKEAGIIHYVRAWQSAGKTRDPWLGPDVLNVVRKLGETQVYKHFIFCPIGFVSEHLEVLYDNDQECRQLVESFGGTYHRPQMPDTDPLFIDALASAVLKALD